MQMPRSELWAAMWWDLRNLCCQVIQVSAGFQVYSHSDIDERFCFKSSYSSGILSIHLVYCFFFNSLFSHRSPGKVARASEDTTPAFPYWGLQETAHLAAAILGVSVLASRQADVGFWQPGLWKAFHSVYRAAPENLHWFSPYFNAHM